MIEKYWILVIGRFIYGLGCGVLSIIGPRFIEETIPDKLLSKYSPMFITTAAFGGMTSLFLAASLPDDDQKDALEETN